MKKALLSIFLILICYLGYGQTYPVTQNLGNTATTKVKTNALEGKLIITAFTDTTAANTEGYLKNYDGSLIKTTSPINALWYRVLDSAKWVQILPTGGGSGGTRAWLDGGNYNVFGDGNGNAVFGTLNLNGVKLTTNATTRLILNKAGIQAETANTVPLGVDTVTKDITYSTGGGGSSSWLLAGNTGTNPLNDFIGTTDSVDFVVKTKALERLRVNANGALGVGTGTDYGTSGYVLQSNGNGTSPTWVIHNNNFDATVDFSVNADPNTGGTTFNPNTPQLTTKIYVSTIDGSQWTWNGSAYVIYTSIGWNIFGNAGTNPLINYIGTSDAQPLIFGVGGNRAGRIDATTYNTSFGLSSMASLTTGDGNSSLGNSSLSFTTSGDYNTAVGYRAMENNDLGSSNTSIGYFSGYINDGDNNLFLGNYAGRYMTTESNRIILNTIDRGGKAADTADSPIYIAQDATAANQRLYLNAKVIAPYLPTAPGIYAVRADASGNLSLADTTSGGGSSTITNGTTAMSGFTNTYIPYNNAGTIGQYAISGTGNVAMSASPIFTGLPQVNAGTIVYPSTSGYNAFSSASGASTGLNVTNTASNGYIQLNFAETTSLYGGFYKWNSTYGGNYTGTSLPFASSFQLQSGAGNDQPIVVSASALITQIGSSGSNKAYRMDGTGLKIGTNADIHTSGTESLDVTGNGLFTGTVNAARALSKQGADIASTAGAMTLGTDGTSFEITGTNTITLLSNVGWANGNEVTLMFTGAATLTDGTANSGTDIGMELAANANFVASAGATIKLILSEIGGTQRWREVSRSVN